MITKIPVKIPTYRRCILMRAIDLSISTRKAARMMTKNGLYENYGMHQVQ